MVDYSKQPAFELGVVMYEIATGDSPFASKLNNKHHYKKKNTPEVFSVASNLPYPITWQARFTRVIQIRHHTIHKMNGL